MLSMKVFIQHEETGHYFKDSGHWVKDEKNAQSFEGSLQAIDYCFENKIENVIIVLKFGDPKYDIELRPFVRKRRGRGRAMANEPASDLDSSANWH